MSTYNQMWLQCTKSLLNTESLLLGFGLLLALLPLLDKSVPSFGNNVQIIKTASGRTLFTVIRSLSGTGSPCFFSFQKRFRTAFFPSPQSANTKCISHWKADNHKTQWHAAMLPKPSQCPDLTEVLSFGETMGQTTQHNIKEHVRIRLAPEFWASIILMTHNDHHHGQPWSHQQPLDFRAVRPLGRIFWIIVSLVNVRHERLMANNTPCQWAITVIGLL